MNRLENLNKKFKKEINEVTEKPGGRYPQKLIDSILKFMIDDIMTDGKHGFSPVEISNVTGINVSVLYRWRKGNSSKKVTKKTTKKASKKISKKKSKLKPDEKIDWEFKNKEFKEAIAEKICRSHITAQLGDILSHELISMKRWEIDDIKKIVKTASLLIEEIQDFSNDEVDFDDFLNAERRSNDL